MSHLAETQAMPPSDRDFTLLTDEDLYNYARREVHFSITLPFWTAIFLKGERTRP